MILIVLCLLDVPGMTLFNFEHELRELICFILGAYVIGLVYIHCKHAGTPYKSEKHYKNVRHLFIVYVVWTLAFILKVILAAIGTSSYIVTRDQPTDDKENLDSSILLVVGCVLSEIIPYVITLDQSFIKIFMMVNYYNPN